MHLLPSALVWLGRQGTRVLAASIFVGIAVPPFAALLKPYFPETVFVLLCLTFLRIEPRAVGAQLARPMVLVATVAWMILVIPLGCGLGLIALGLDRLVPGLTLALVLQVISPPLMSAPALAALLGLEAALSLTAMVLATLAAPLTAPLFAEALLGAAIGISPLLLGAKLCAFLAGSALIAAAIRRLAGAAWTARQKERIDGLNVIGIAVFAVALMDGMAARIVAEPLLVLGLTGVAFAIALGLMALTGLVFAGLGSAAAFEVALTSGYRNMGLMVAAMAATVPDFTWTYFAVAQFPIYLLPHALKLVAQRTGLLAKPAAGGKAR